MRKLIPFVLFVALVIVPAAFAASVIVPAGNTRLATASLLDQPFRAHIAARKRAARKREEARRRAAKRAAARFRSVAIPPQLASIANCESHGDPRAIGGGGTYRGKYQFNYSTWASVGGSGDPAAAPEAEQDYRAALLYKRSGPGQWPVCGA